MKKRLENAAFPFEKTLDEFRMDRLNPSISPSFISVNISLQNEQLSRTR